MILRIEMDSGSAPASLPSDHAEPAPAERMIFDRPSGMVSVIARLRRTERRERYHI
jgi:hypothetical protein